MIKNDKILRVKKSNKYYCKLCDYNAQQKSNYNRHIQSKRHKHTEMIICESNLGVNIKNVEKKMVM